MARAKGLRGSAEDAGIPLNHRQLTQFRKYGLLSSPDKKKSDAQLLERVKQIREAKDEAQTLDRRLFYLHDSEWPIETKFVRKAVGEVASKIRTPVKKNRALFRCLQSRSQLMQDVKAVKSIPESWRLPPQESWPATFSWPSDDDFRTIYEWCRSEVIALAYVPGMKESEDFQTAPFEEMVVLLILHQLSIPSQDLTSTTKEMDPWP